MANQIIAQTEIPVNPPDPNGNHGLAKPTVRLGNPMRPNVGAFGKPSGVSPFNSKLSNCKTIEPTVSGIGHRVYKLHIPNDYIVLDTTHADDCAALDVLGKLVDLAALTVSSYNKLPFTLSIQWQGKGQHKVIEKIAKVDETPRAETPKDAAYKVFKAAGKSHLISQKDVVLGLVGLDVAAAIAFAESYLDPRATNRPACFAFGRGAGVVHPVEQPIALATVFPRDDKGQPVTPEEQRKLDAMNNATIDFDQPEEVAKPKLHWSAEKIFRVFVREQRNQYEPSKAWSTQQTEIQLHALACDITGKDIESLTELPNTDEEYKNFKTAWSHRLFASYGDLKKQPAQRVETPESAAKPSPEDIAKSRAIFNAQAESTEQGDLSADSQTSAVDVHDTPASPVAAPLASAGTGIVEMYPNYPESPVVVYPKSDGSVIFAGIRFSVTLRIGGTFPMAVPLMDSFAKYREYIDPSCLVQAKQMRVIEHDDQPPALDDGPDEIDKKEYEQVSGGGSEHGTAICRNVADGKTSYTLWYNAGQQETKYPCKVSSPQAVKMLENALRVGGFNPDKWASGKRYNSVRVDFAWSQGKEFAEGKHYRDYTKFEVIKESEEMPA